MKKRFAMFSVVFMATLLVPSAAMADPALTPLATVGGAELTDGATYSIGTEADLAKLVSLVNGGEDCTGNYFVVTNDIVLTEDHNGTSGDSGTAGKWTPIGWGTFHPTSFPAIFGPAFNGTFYGQNHTISGLDLQRESCSGLFGNIGSGGLVLDLIVDGAITGADCAGGIAAINSGTIVNCANKATYTNATATEYQYIGGVVGANVGTVQNCRNTAAISGGADRHVGGVVGYCRGTPATGAPTIANCFNTAPVTGQSNVGGVVGSCVIQSGEDCALIRNCYNTGDVTANGTCGGIVGILGDSDITNCYSAGDISVTDFSTSGPIGGMIGLGCTAENCFWLQDAAFTGFYGSASTIDSVINCVSFTGTDLLTSDVDGIYSLCDALNYYVMNNESYQLRRWDIGSSFPTLNGITMLTNPSDRFVATLGDTASFTVLAVGSSMTYRWQVSADDGFTWTDVSTGSGANTPRYTTPPVTDEMNGCRYHCTFSTGESSYGAKLGAGGVAPEIITQPLDQYLTNGATGFITLSATGNPDPTYEWFVSMDGTYWFSAGVTTASTSTPPMDPTYDGLYSLKCVVTNPMGSVTSDIIKLYLASSPTITTQPADKTAAVGKTATFSVTAAGKPLPAYQWQINRGSGWDDISGAIDRTYTTAAVTLANDGYHYRVVVTNSAGHVTSQAAALQVVEEAVIPGTGDTARPGLWLGVGLLAAACLAALALMLWRRRGTRA